LVCCIVHRLEDAVKLTEGLHLTDEQKAKISALTKKQTEESQALCAKAHEGHKATHAQILALLTPDQQQKLHALETTMPEHSTGGPGSAGGKERQPSSGLIQSSPFKEPPSAYFRQPVTLFRSPTWCGISTGAAR
jgi:Spy/CpxP family protein refolding chaperone